jgi:glycosyltransferase involved in cell wall biosynthesis
MKKILFISYDGMTDPLGQSQVIPYLIGLSKFGYKFTILSCDKPAAFAANKNYVENLVKGSFVEWVSIPYHKRPAVLSSMYDYWRLKQAASQLHKKRNYDMVHTRPGIPTLVALWMKKKKGIRFLNDVRGFWADERVDGGMWDLKKPLFKKIYHFFKKHEYECLEMADHITCLTQAAKMEMRSWKNIKAQPLPIDVIPCSTDLDLFNPGNINTALKEQIKNDLGLKNEDIIFSYLGSIGGWYLTDEMMQFCKLLSHKMPAAKFLFISPHRHDQIISAAANAGLAAEKIITAHAQRHEVPVLLSFSNYSLFFIKRCYSKISSSPTKHGEIMAMGIPVITNAGIGDVKEIVEKYNSGIVLDDLSQNSMEAAIKKIISGPVFDKEKIKKGAQEVYSLEQAVQSYKLIYDKILL